MPFIDLPPVGKFPSVIGYSECIEPDCVDSPSLQSGCAPGDGAHDTARRCLAWISCRRTNGGPGYPRSISRALMLRTDLGSIGRFSGHRRLPCELGAEPCQCRSNGPVSWYGPESRGLFQTVRIASGSLGIFQTVDIRYNRLCSQNEAHPDCGNRTRRWAYPDRTLSSVSYPVLPTTGPFSPPRDFRFGIIFATPQARVRNRRPRDPVYKAVMRQVYRDAEYAMTPTPCR